MAYPIHSNQLERDRMRRMASIVAGRPALGMGFGGSNPSLNLLLAQQIADAQDAQDAPEHNLTQSPTMSEADAVAMQSGYEAGAPYLEGLTPYGRFKDMELRRRANMQQAGQGVRAVMAANAMQNNANFGVTRRFDPSGNLVSNTAGGGQITRFPTFKEKVDQAWGDVPPPTIAPQPFSTAEQTQMPVDLPGTRRELTSPYGTGSSEVMGAEAFKNRKPGTFSFQTPEGERFTLPFSALNKEDVRKFMRREDAASTLRKKADVNQESGEEALNAALKA